MTEKTEASESVSKPKLLTEKPEASWVWNHVFKYLFKLLLPVFKFKRPHCHLFEQQMLFDLRMIESSQLSVFLSED